MDTEINILSKKLLLLMGDVHYRYDFDKALDSPEQLLEIGEHNSREYDKFEAMEEESKERIWNLISNILASGFQKEAMEKYGNTDSSSIRQILLDMFKQPDDQAYWDRLMQTAKQGLLGFNLTEDQCQAVITYYYDMLPQAIIEGLEELIRPLRLLPRAEAQSITMALADMMKGARDANSFRDN